MGSVIRFLMRFLMRLVIRLVLLHVSLCILYLLCNQHLDVEIADFSDA